MSPIAPRSLTRKQCCPALRALFAQRSAMLPVVRYLSCCSLTATGFCSSISQRRAARVSAPRCAANCWATPYSIPNSSANGSADGHNIGWASATEPPCSPAQRSIARRRKTTRPMPAMQHARSCRTDGCAIEICAARAVPLSGVWGCVRK